MPGIIHRFTSKASPSSLYTAISTPPGVDAWWSQNSKGEAKPGSKWLLDFGAGHSWEAVVRTAQPDHEFELEMTKADADWMGTRIRFRLKSQGDRSQVLFEHSGWAECNEHYYVSNTCWAMYLRILRRYVEYGEFVAYEDRLDA